MGASYLDGDRLIRQARGYCILIEAMTFRPHLTVEQRRDIQTRYRDDVDVIALLWEVRRLHGMLLRDSSDTSDAAEHICAFSQEMADDKSGQSVGAEG